MKSILLVFMVSGSLAAATRTNDLAQGERLEQAGQKTEIERVYQQVLERTQDLSAAQLNALAIELNQERRYREAEWVYRRSLEAWDRLGPKVMVSRSITEDNLGMLLQQEGRYSEAESVMLEAARGIEAMEGIRNLNNARAVSALAALYSAWGRPEKAEPWAEQADQIFSALDDASKEERVASRQMRASLLLAQGKYPEGEGMLRAMVGELPDAQAVGAYNDLAVAETAQNHFAEAEVLASHALELAQRVFPPQHPLAAASLNNLAQVQRFQGRYLQAETNYREAIAAWEHTFGPQHPDTAKGVMNLAAFYHERGREAGAEDLYRRAAGIFENTLGRDHPLTLVARNELGDVLRAEHRYSESEKLSRATLGPLETSLGEQDPRVVRALTNYARLLKETRHPGEASAIRKRAEGLAQGFRSQHP